MALSNVFRRIYVLLWALAQEFIEVTILRRREKDEEAIEDQWISDNSGLALSFHHASLMTPFIRKI